MDNVIRKVYPVRICYDLEYSAKQTFGKIDNFVSLHSDIIGVHLNMGLLSISVFIWKSFPLYWNL